LFHFFTEKKFMLTLNRVSYIHPNGDRLFENIDLAIHHHEKIALIGNNGAGKSTLLQLLAGLVRPSSGTIRRETKTYYVPQHTGQFNDRTVAEALQVDRPLLALQAIIGGAATEEHLATLNDDWLLEERCREALAAWHLDDTLLHRSMASLSGGQKTKVFLAGIVIHQPDIILLDEPSNHLDNEGREQLYHYIATTDHSLVVVSHDQQLLRLLPTIYTLDPRGLTRYGGDYDFYTEQKKIAEDALHHDLKSKEKALRKAKEVERESLERRQRLDARGKKKQEKAGLPTISMNTFRNNAEKSTSRIKDVHADKIQSIAQDLNTLRQEIPDMDKMKIDLGDAALHHGKRLIEAHNLNMAYHERMLWQHPLSFLITSGERVAIAGGNGSGKTTLIRIMLGEVQPTVGTLERAEVKSVYIDQDYSWIDLRLTVFGQAQRVNDNKLPEHEIKIRLNRFLFSKNDWDKPCHALSGGEKMRLMLCCLTISNQTPDMIVLDEPTNNLDIQNTTILIAAMRDYRGTLIVISHDKHFLEEVRVDKNIHMISGKP
jgi:ATPase subunit of ABC transporter with duplicated ATPase domains